jgi:hypothetical protein
MDIISVCKKPPCFLGFDKKLSMTRFAKSEKGEFTMVNAFLSMSIAQSWILFASNN